MISKKTNESKTRLVVYLTGLTMVVEIIFGLLTKSMSLFADGIHMLSHTGALGLSLIAYLLVKKHKGSNSFKNGTDKILSLSGYTSGIILIIFAIYIIYESCMRFFLPVAVNFKDAIFVAIIGLLVNLISARLLHHDEAHSDHNIKAAYLHVLADALTSVTAIIGLIAGLIWNIVYVDAIGGLISSAVIIRWSYGLLKRTSLELVDYKK